MGQGTGTGSAAGYVVEHGAPARSGRRRRGPVVLLLVLAPIVGEYLLGNVPVRAAAGLLVLAPLYGGGALLVREVVRRRGRGAGAMLAAGAAYGVIEAGLIDGSLFNPQFQGMALGAAPVPWLGVSAYYALHFVVGHAVWSITVPIVIAESWAREQARQPWLPRRALVVVGVVYLAGGLLIQLDMRQTSDFRTSMPQAAGTLLVAGTLLGLALGPWPRAGRPPSAAAVPRPARLVLPAFVLSSLFFGASESWPGVLWSVSVLLVAALLVRRMAGGAGWSRRHELALAVGVLPTYAWGSFVVTSLRPDSTPADHAGNVVVALLVALVVVVAVRQTRRHETIPAS
jgi:hypothetical protein